MRFVYNSSDALAMNYLEIKLLLPTLTPDGVVGSWCLGPMRRLPAAMSSTTACPFAKCVSVSYDNDLGLLEVEGEPVGAVRLLVRILARRRASALPLLTRRRLPDTAQGHALRVMRRVVCALEPPSDDMPVEYRFCLLYTSPSPRDKRQSRMPSSA